jgi:hypothetical protein
VDRARDTLDAARHLFETSEIAYFEGRLSLADRRDTEARAHFDRAATDGGEIGARAARFRAVTWPQHSSERMEALASLEPTPDVIVEMLELDPVPALAAFRDVGHDGDDLLGWFLWKAAQGPGEELSPQDRVLFHRLARDLVGIDRLGLLALLETFARRHGLEQQAEIFAVRQRGVAEKAAARMLRRVYRAEEEGRLEEAADLLWQVTRLTPAREQYMRPLLSTLMKTGDQGRVTALLDEFRVMGRSEAYLRALVREAADATDERLSLGEAD